MSSNSNDSDWSFKNNKLVYLFTAFVIGSNLYPKVMQSIDEWQAYLNQPEPIPDLILTLDQTKERLQAIYESEPTMMLEDGLERWAALPK